ncbi:exonuclease/endonuclease/phosphatase family protein [Pseudomonas chlororaphis]|uniref:hypothetical protein n=1 Tax=Pseudomonas chlororaphis TaxID=587753 RepID=UPI0003D2F12C|nr:hypothetical protein [Pseudomonas chlororaphis]AZD29210.1 hypothetical protein C4K23_2461 [Pseudomonas chlororaphis]ETD37995.1 hypothetical protein U724_20270 [Pseudomonas chlororaphis subsp. aurantiaca PB-St2]QFS54718.1 hypothetical protein FD951_09185 [Pseudomonas chlororaphis subsp. aurantiaca]
MKILNWNTKRCDASQANVIECYIAEKAPDLICLQEVAGTSELSDFLNNLSTSGWTVLTEAEGYGGKYYYMLFRNASFSSLPTSLVKFSPWSDPQSGKLYSWSYELFGAQNGRSPVYADATYLGKDYRIANWHAPIKVQTSGCLSMTLKGGTNLEAMIGLDSSQTFDPLQTNKRVILVGDFNVHQSELAYDWQGFLIDAEIQEEVKSIISKKIKKTPVSKGFKPPTSQTISKPRTMRQRRALTHTPSPQFMKKATLFDSFTSITPGQTSLEHLLVSYDVNWDIHLMSPGEGQTINSTLVTNLSDHTLVFVTLEDA